MTPENKFHLCNPQRLPKSKDGISLWKGKKMTFPSGKANTEDEDEDIEETTEEKNYIFMRRTLAESLWKGREVYSARYSDRFLTKRKEINQKPKIYIKSNVFNLIKTWTPFFDDLKLKAVKFDPLLKQYIFVQNVEDFHIFERKIEEFINEEPDWKQTVVLIKDFEIFTAQDRKDSNYLYAEGGRNVDLNIKIFQDANPEEILEVFRNLGIPSENIIQSNTKTFTIKSGSIDEDALEIIFQCCDSLERIEGKSIYEIGPDGLMKAIELPYYPEVDMTTTPENIACVIDSWIQNIDSYQSIIDTTPWINFACNYGNPLEDAMAPCGGHWTCVAWIVAFGKQIFRKKQKLDPICKICSIKITIPTFEEDEVINKMIELHTSFWVSVFNLSFGEKGASKDNQYPNSFTSKLDEIMHRYDLICVISAWNLKYPPEETKTKLYDNYPRIWQSDEANIPHLACSINSLVVGSLWHWKDEFWSDWDFFVTSHSRKSHISILDKRHWYWHYSQKPDLVVFWGDKLQNKPFYTFWSEGSIVTTAWTSFAAPYVTHLLLLLKDLYRDLRMQTLKALILLNTTVPSKSICDYYFKWHGISHKKIYGNWFLWEHWANWEEEVKLLYSNDDCVNIIIEDEIDFSNYDAKKWFPLCTWNLKIPNLEDLVKYNNRNSIAIKAVLCYSPHINSEGEIYSDYNTCHIWFMIHSWGATLGEIKTQPGVSNLEAENMGNMDKKTWSDTPGRNQMWNNAQMKFFRINRKNYKTFVDWWIQITIKSRIKDSKEAEEYYKRVGRQTFSLVLQIKDEWIKEAWEVWILYESIKSLNNLKLANDVSLIAEVH